MSGFSHNLCSIFPIVISLVVFLSVYRFKILQWLDVFHIYHSPCISCTATSYPRLSTTRTNEPDIMSSFYCYKYKTTIPFPLFLSPIRQPCLSRSIHWNSHYLIKWPFYCCDRKSPKSISFVCYQSSPLFWSKDRVLI